MTLKLIMHWDIKPGKDQEYFEFILREWVPATSSLGLKTIGAWYSIYSRQSETPRLMAEALIEDRESMVKILESHTWERMHNRLLEYVDNYSQKVVRATGYFQL